MIGTINFGAGSSNLKTKIYGVRRALSSSSSSWERIEDSIGLIANAQQGTETVKNDFDSIYPWCDIISCNYDTTNNKINAYYGDENFEFDGSNGQVMTIIPQFYYRRYQDNEYEYILISKKPLKGYVKSEQFMIGRYATNYGGNGNTIPIIASGYIGSDGKTVAEARTKARGLGDGWQLMDWHYFLIQLLYLVEYADYNSQVKLGNGQTDANDRNIVSGECNSLGMKSGSLNTSNVGYQNSVIYRGIEDLFGIDYQLIDGINIKNCQVYINYNPLTYDSSSFSGNYKMLSYLCPDTSNKTKLAKKLGYDIENPLIAFPIEVSDTIMSSGIEPELETYITDGFYSTNNKELICLVGGNFIRVKNCGLWYYTFNTARTSTSFRTRFIKI